MHVRILQGEVASKTVGFHNENHFLYQNALRLYSFNAMRVKNNDWKFLGAERR